MTAGTQVLYSRCFSRLNQSWILRLCNLGLLWWVWAGCFSGSGW